MLTFAAAGPATTGRFFSAARNRTVGYSIAYPPGHGPGSALRVAISLHGFAYAEARAANASAFASAADFAGDDVINHASALTGIPVRVVEARERCTDEATDPAGDDTAASPPSSVVRG